jgi:DNA ligase-1
MSFVESVIASKNQQEILALLENPVKTFVDAIQLAEIFTTKKEKLKALSGLDSKSLMLVKSALNPYENYGVHKWPTPTFSATDADYSIFLDILPKLASREVSGNAARDLVSATLANYTKTTAKYLARVLNKNLDCGATSTTFLKVYPTLDIPKFEVMLASKIDSSTVWTFPKLLQAKLDGTRLIAIVTESSVEYFSRSGKPSDFCNGIFDAELLQLRKEINNDIVVDGEALGNSFQATMHAKGENNVEAKNALKFYAFDIMSLKDWKSQSCTTKQATRTTYLASLIQKLNLKKIVHPRTKTVSSYKEALDFYNEILLEGVNDDGSVNGLGEGLIVKDPFGLYEFDRSKNWAKWKPVINVDLTLVGVYEGTGKYVGTTGGLYLEGYDENKNFIKTACGSGLDDKTRKMIWKNKDSLLGKTVMLETQELTKAQNFEETQTYSLRFPVFIKFRDDK